MGQQHGQHGQGLLVFTLFCTHDDATAVAGIDQINQLLSVWDACTASAGLRLGADGEYSLDIERILSWQFCDEHNEEDAIIRKICHHHPVQLIL